jgi:hypothetical protein
MRNGLHRIGATLALLSACALSVAGAGDAPASLAPEAGAPGPAALPDSAIHADSAALSDSAAVELHGFDAPTWVMVRSALVPGWGQAKNGSWWKALLVAGLEGAFLERLHYEDRRVHVYRAKAAAVPAETSTRDYLDAKVRRHLAHRRDFTWWTAFFAVLALADAYVDAHLRHFDVRLEATPGASTPVRVDAPAAPPEPDGGPPGAGWGLRVGLRLGG